MKTIISLIFILLISFCCAQYKSDQIKLTDISALTFVRGESTSARRTSPIPQLECVSGSARYDTSVQPQTVQCINVGNDGKSVQWKCDANLDNKVKFGKIVVSCEGYSHKDDPYVLVGSCGLRYGLEYENGASQTNSHTQSSQRHYYDDTQYESSSWLTTIFNFLFYGLLIAFVYYTISFIFTRTNNNPGYGMPAYGPQPGANPYGPQQGAYPYGQGNPYPGYGASSSYGAYPSYGSYGTGGGWWSGFATGGLLGSLWNRPTTNYGYRSGYATPSYSNRSFGGSSFSSGSSSSGSSSRRSTGYGSSETR